MHDMNSAAHTHGAELYYLRKTQDFEALNPFSQTGLTKELRDVKERDFSDFLLRIK